MGFSNCSKTIKAIHIFLLSGSKQVACENKHYGTVGLTWSTVVLRALSTDNKDICLHVPQFYREGKEKSRSIDSSRS